MEIEGEFMKKVAIIFLLIITLCSCSKVNETTKVDEQNEVANVVKFNKISLDIPKGWVYNVDPEARQGVDQLQLYCKEEEKGLLVITVTDHREKVSLDSIVRDGGKIMAGRMIAAPQFNDCIVQGSGEGSRFLGREGILVSFNLVKNPDMPNKSIAMKINSFGEELKETNEVLLITTYNTTENYTDMEKIIKSMRMLKK